MPQNSDKNLARKLSQLSLQHDVVEADFIAAKGAEMLSEYVDFYSCVKTEARGRAMLLYERNTDMLTRLTERLGEIDQVPFGMIAQPPAQLRAMLPSEQYSLLLSNLAFDWTDAGQFIQLLDHLMQPDALFWFSTFGPATADHTRSIIEVIDPVPHFNEFYDLQDIGDALLGAGFRDVVLESTLINLEYTSVDVLLADARRVFGLNRHPERRRNLTPPGVLREFTDRVSAVIEEQGGFSEQVEILVAQGRKAVVPGVTGVIPVREG